MVPPVRLPAGVAGSLDEMDPGTIFLRVPVRGDAVQVGTADVLPTATIEVRTTASTVSVRRTDGRALQAQITHRRPGGGEERSGVFTEPVAALRLRRFRALGGPGEWVVTGAEDARNAGDLTQLVATITCFALAKQRRLAAGQPAARPA